MDKMHFQANNLYGICFEWCVQLFNTKLKEEVETLTQLQTLWLYCLPVYSINLFVVVLVSIHCSCVDISMGWTNSWDLFFCCGCHVTMARSKPASMSGPRFSFVEAAMTAQLLHWGLDIIEMWCHEWDCWILKIRLWEFNLILFSSRIFLFSPRQCCIELDNSLFFSILWMGEKGKIKILRLRMRMRIQMSIFIQCTHSSLLSSNTRDRTSHKR